MVLLVMEGDWFTGSSELLILFEQLKVLCGAEHGHISLSVPCQTGDSVLVFINYGWVSGYFVAC